MAGSASTVRVAAPFLLLALLLLPRTADAGYMLGKGSCHDVCDGDCNDEAIYDHAAQERELNSLGGSVGCVEVKIASMNNLNEVVHAKHPLLRPPGPNGVCKAWISTNRQEWNCGVNAGSDYRLCLCGGASSGVKKVPVAQPPPPPQEDESEVNEEL